MYLVMLLIAWDHSEINMMLKKCQHMFPNKLTFQWSRRTFLCYHICSSTWAEHIRQPFSLIDQRSFSWVSSFLYSPISSLLVQRNNKTIAHGFWHMSCKIVYYCLILRVSSVNYFQSVKLGKPQISEFIAKYCFCISMNKPLTNIRGNNLTDCATRAFYYTT